MKTCPACLEELPLDARFCGVCGFKLANVAAASQPLERPRVLSPDGTAARPSPSQEVLRAATELGVAPVHRRRGPSRQLRRFPLRARTLISDEIASFGGSVENISTGGAFVCSEAQPEIGTKLELHFALPVQAEPLVVQAEVVWHRAHQPATGQKAGFGLRFEGLPPSAEEAILVFIGHRDERFLRGGER